MPNCDFYALGDDCRKVVEFIFTQPQWKLVELTSLPGQPLREFHSIEDLVTAVRLGEEHVHTQLYSPTMRGMLWHERVRLARGAAPGANYRFASRGWGLVQLYFGAVEGEVLTNSHTNCNSETRALAWAPTYADEPDRVEDWNWREVARISRALNSHIRKLAVAKHGSRPLLPRAQQALAQGHLRLG